MVEKWKLDYDERQYSSMQEQVSRYEEGKIDLATLIASLDSLLVSLEAASKAWKNEFRRKWAVLEEVYAVALDRVEQGAAPSAETAINEAEHKKLINGAINDISRLLANRNSHE